MHGRDIIGKYLITDLKTQSEQWEDDFLEAIRIKDYLFNQLKHPVSILNRETRAEFNWLV